MVYHTLTNASKATVSEKDRNDELEQGKEEQKLDNAREHSNHESGDKSFRKFGNNRKSSRDREELA